MQPASLFLGHGSPMTLIEPSPSREFLAALPARFARPEAILMVSAHWQAARPTLTAAALPDTIHDFGGFPDELYRATYPAPGSPWLARRVADLLGQGGLAADLDPARGLDHGAWIPLAVAWPAAKIPVVQLSLMAGKDAAAHMALGRALRPLAADKVLIIGSGNLTHNLGEAMAWMQSGGRGEAAWAAEFAAAMNKAVLAGDDSALAEWETTMPHARRAHPTSEHLLPLHVAYGAGGGAASCIHNAMELGSLSMASFAFELAQAPAI